MKLTWLTDIHLNFLEHKARLSFYRNIVEADCDAVLITGDIAEAPSVIELLREMAAAVSKPIYFVLGNHDYYGGNIHDVRESAATLTQTQDQLFWLPEAHMQWLTDDTLILGQDGWADGRLGDYQNSSVSMNDSRMIADLYQQLMQGMNPLVEKMQQLADRDAASLHDELAQAVALHPQKIIILTHIPPFKESCLHKGKASTDDWLPYFTSKATGDVLMQVAQTNTEIEFLVLCGHTHSEATYQPLPNLTVKAGRADYERPIIQEILTIESARQTPSPRR